MKRECGGADDRLGALLKSVRVTSDGRGADVLHIQDISIVARVTSVTQLLPELPAVPPPPVASECFSGAEGHGDDAGKLS